MSPFVIPIKSYFKLSDISHYVDMFAQLHEKHLAN